MEFNQKSDENGTIKISEDVIATIAMAAAKEIKGVSGASQNFVSDIKGIIAKKSTVRGIKVEGEGEGISLELYLNFEYTSKLQDVACQVQTNVKNAVETMTGLTVSSVHIHVQGIVTPQIEEASSDLGDIKGDA